MKPCSSNRKLIAWLALDELDARQARDLRAHLETCEGCRGYLAEISSVAGKLAAVEMPSDVQASATFHRRVVAGLRAGESGSVRETLLTQVRETALNWGIAVPVLVLIAVIAAFPLFKRSRDLAPSVKSTAQVVPVVDSTRDLPPTIANYQMVANQSLEKLDELLNRQANRNPAPTRIYTASGALD